MDKNTPFLQALRNGHRDMAKDIMEDFVDENSKTKWLANTTNKHGNTALHICCENNERVNFDCFEFILNNLKPSWQDRRRIYTSPADKKNQV